MAFTLPNLDEITETLIADFRGRFPNANVSKRSNHWKRIRSLAVAILGLHRHGQVIERDILPDRCSGDMLDRWGVILDLPRKPATPAKKADALRLVGTAASPFTSGTQLTSSDGLTFQLNESGVIPAGGFLDVDVLAVSLGSETRKSKNDVLTFVSPPGGIQSQAELQLDMDEDGDDEEDHGSYRARILDKIAQPGMGGNANDYRQWAEEVTGVASAYVFPLRYGLGTVDLACLHTGSGSVRALTSPERTEVQTHIDEERPVAMAGFRVIETIATPTDVEILLEPQDGDEWAFDWNDSSPPTVTSYIPGVRVLKMSTRPADLSVGDRLFNKNVVTRNSGVEYVVEALGPAADEVTLEEEPDVTPEVGVPIYSGGPLVQPVREGVLEHVDGMGPSRGEYAEGLWVGTLYTSSLFKIAQLTDGVLDSTLAAPPGNVVPANDPSTAQVSFVTPRQIIARRKW